MRSAHSRPLRALAAGITHCSSQLCSARRSICAVHRLPSIHESPRMNISTTTTKAHDRHHDQTHTTTVNVTTITKKQIGASRFTTQHTNSCVHVEEKTHYDIAFYNRECTQPIRTARHCRLCLSMRPLPPFGPSASMYRDRSCLASSAPHLSCFIGGAAHAIGTVAIGSVQLQIVILVDELRRQRWHVRVCGRQTDCASACTGTGRDRCCGVWVDSPEFLF